MYYSLDVTCTVGVKCIHSIKSQHDWSHSLNNINGKMQHTFEYATVETLKLLNAVLEM